MDMNLIIGIAAVVIFVIVVVCTTSAVWPIIIGAPWVPTSRRIVRKMLELAEVDENDVVMDLGSGDGRIILIAAEEFGARAIGIEADPLRVIWSRFVVWRKRLTDKVKVVRGNFFNHSIEDATVVTVYQNHEINQRLKPKFIAELKPGTRVVSFDFSFRGWKPKKTIAKPSVRMYEI